MIFIVYRPNAVFVLVHIHSCNYFNHNASPRTQFTVERKFSSTLLSPSRNRPLKKPCIFGTVSAGLIASNSPIARARTRAGSSAVKSSWSRRERGGYIHDFRLRSFRACGRMTCCIISWAYGEQTRRGDDENGRGWATWAQKYFLRKQSTRSFQLKLLQKSKFNPNIQVSEHSSIKRYKQEKSVFILNHKYHSLKVTIRIFNVISSLLFEQLYARKQF